MDKHNIAVILLGRQNAGLSFILDSASRNKLGTDGFAEALALRWIQPSLEFDCMFINQEPAILEAIRAAASKPEQPPAAGLVSEARDIFFNHASAHPDFESSVLSGNRLFENQTPTTAVGSQVTVVDGGKTYIGTVQAVKGNGKFAISFPNESKPQNVKAEYDATEFTVDSEGDKPGAPAVTKPSPSVSTAGTPPALGVGSK